METTNARPAGRGVLRLRATPALAGVAAVACLLLPASASAAESSAAAVRPPAGTPDLSKMALAPSDLASARVARQGYVKPDRGIVASYVREFRPGARLGSKSLLFIESDIDLMRTVADARDYLNLVYVGIVLLDADDFAREFARSSGLELTYVKTGGVVKVRAGDQAWALTIRMGTRAGEIRLVLSFLREDRVLSYVVMVGSPRAKIGSPDAARLGRVVSAHVVDGLVPSNTALPTISGTPQAGQTLTAAPGSWTNKPTAFGYQWQRCDASGSACTALAGATSGTYALTSADAGSTLRVSVTARNAVGSRAAISAETTIVAAEGAPASTAPPTISGTVAVGQTLSADPGTWTGSPTSFAYQWRRCDASGAGCTDVVGATSQTYTVASSDTGFTLRVAVTATNATGSTLAVSVRTASVP